jgi:hypothetical protein
VTKVNPPPARLVLTGHPPRVLLRQSFVDMEHLWTARHAARLCSEREPQLRPNEYDIEHRSLVMTAIFFAAASLEALVNEVIRDVNDAPAGGTSGRVAGIRVNATRTAAFQELRRRERSIRPPTEKYQRALDAVGKPRYSENRDPLKSAKLLFNLRNHFVHFKPETRDIADPHEFEIALKPKIVENQQQIGVPWFPNKALGAGLAQWACDSSARFASSWWKRMGLRGSYDASFSQLPPP